VPGARRSDARRNRAAILRAAVEAFTGGCGTVTVQGIARRAGVGQATVYRHFPDRRTLAVAVLREHLAALERMVAAAAGEPAAFRSLLRDVLLAQASMRPLVTVLRQLPAREQRWCADQVLAVLTGPFRRSQEAHHLRRDVQLSDLPLVFAMLEATLESTVDSGTSEAAVRRVIDVILDGLFRTGSLTPDRWSRT